ncbi:Hypothetical predicted protein [Octopus vulgaris]|uniref:Uncharacterized protein n=1 Tax=Octopus vulgaris TaxID=6645 RepID=A0AA36AUB7_OCTVU|nr:Hypothetical predicted protein [Octopus vulgaris]
MSYTDSMSSSEYSSSEEKLLRAIDNVDKMNFAKVAKSHQKNITLKQDGRFNELSKRIEDQLVVWIEISINQIVMPRIYNRKPGSRSYKSYNQKSLDKAVTDIKAKKITL